MSDFEKYETGAVRDSQADKPRFDLISPTFLLRLATLLGEKAKHYGDRNWEQGILASRSFASLERHVQAIKRGDYSEDHIAQAAANLMFLAEEQDGPNDDLDTLVGPALRRQQTHQADTVEELMTDLNDVPKVDNIVDGTPENFPDALSEYTDRLGNVWAYKGLIYKKGHPVDVYWGPKKDSAAQFTWRWLVETGQGCFPWTKNV